MGQAIGAFMKIPLALGASNGRKLSSEELRFLRTPTVDWKPLDPNSAPQSSSFSPLQRTYTPVDPQTYLHDDTIANRTFFQPSTNPVEPVKMYRGGLADYVKYSRKKKS